MQAIVDPSCEQIGCLFFTLHADRLGEETSAQNSNEGERAGNMQRQLFYPVGGEGRARRDGSARRLRLLLRFLLCSACSAPFCLACLCKLRSDARCKKTRGEPAAQPRLFSHSVRQASFDCARQAYPFPSNQFRLPARQHRSASLSEENSDLRLACYAGRCVPGMRDALVIEWLGSALSDARCCTLLLPLRARRR